MVPSNKKSNIRVLHVDDDLCFLEVSKQILSMENNFEIDTAPSVGEAFKKIEKQQYDVVVSDYEMPQKNGLDFLNELREKNNQIPFILFTGKGREEVAVKALNFGADSYLNKNGLPETVYCELAHAINKTFEQKKSREILRESEKRYRELADSLPNTVFEADLNGQVIFTNKIGYKTSGYSQVEFEKGLNIMQFLAPEDRERALKNIQLLLAGGNSIPIEYTFMRKDGTTFPVLITTALIICQNKVTGLRGVVLDISERKKSEETLRKSEERYRELANFLPEIVFETNLTGKIVFFSKRAMEVTGRTREELEKGLNMLSFVVPEEREKAAVNMKKSITGENLGSNEYALSRKDGTIFSALVSTSPIVSENKVTGLRGLVIDITKRKQDEQALKESEEKYRKLFEESMDAVLVADIETGMIVDCNSAASNLVGREKSELVGQHQSIITPQEQMDGEFARVFKKHIKDQTGTLETQIIRKTGEIRDVAVRDTVFELNGKKLMQGTLRDITEYKKTEKSLKESEEKFRNLAEESPNMIFINLRGRVVYANKKCEDTMGYTKEEFYSPNFNFFSIIAPDSIELLKSSYAMHMRGEDALPYEYVLVTKDGQKIEAIITSKLIEYNGEKAILGIVTDITERERAKRELKESKERYRSLFEQAPLPVAITPLNGTILDANSAMQAFLGGSLEELKKISVAQLYENPEDRERLFEILKQEGVVSDFSTRLRCKDGNFVDVVLNVSKFKIGKEIFLRTTVQDVTERKKAEKALYESQQKFKALFSANPDAAVLVDPDFHVVEANSRFSKLFGYSFGEVEGKVVTDLIVPDGSEEESRVGRKKILSGPAELVTSRKRKDGSLVPLFMSGGPVVVDGKTIGSIMVYKDISDIITVQEELSKALNKAELLNEKLRVVGSLSRHDVRNKLSAVNGYVYLLRKKHAGQVNILEGLSKMEQTINEIVRIFDFAKLYEQIGIEELTSIDVEEKVIEAVALFSGPIPTIINECHGLTVLADSFLRQLFYNFIDNTRKYGKKTTAIRIHFEKSEHENLKLIYEDDGVGVPFENKLCLFKEGFSTGGSTGFGLFLIKKMLDVYGWEIEENGEPGKGAKFAITIPKLNKNGKENYQISK